MTAATGKSRNLMKEAADRPRLNFSALREFSPELAERSLVIRSRVKDLRKKFHEDANWALDNFNRLTGLALVVGGSAIIGALAISLLVKGSTVAVSVSLAFGALAGLLTAGTKAFGWHQRYQAMFHARWAITAIETAIDQELHEIAISLPPDGALGDVERDRLTAASKAWLAELSRVLNTFGESYGAALSPVELKKLAEKTE